MLPLVWQPDIPFSPKQNFFDQNAITAMVMALEDVCRAIHANGDQKAREAIAIRIIALAERGERSPTRLRDRLLQEANGTWDLATYDKAYRVSSGRTC